MLTSVELSHTFIFSPFVDVQITFFSLSFPTTSRPHFWSISHSIQSCRCSYLGQFGIDRFALNSKILVARGKKKPKPTIISSQHPPRSKSLLASFLSPFPCTPIHLLPNVYQMKSSSVISTAHRNLARSDLLNTFSMGRPTLRHLKEASVLGVCG